MADNLTFQIIYDAVAAAIGDNGASGAQSRIDEIKAVVNMVYQEVMSCDDLYPLFWMMDMIDDIKTKTEKAITGITAANPCIVTSAGHGLVTGDIVQLSDITGMTELNDRVCVAVKDTADRYLLADLSGNAIDASAYTAYASGGKARHRGVSLAKEFSLIRSFSWKGYSEPVSPISISEIDKSASLMDVNTLGKPAKYLHKPYFVGSWTESGLGSYILPADDFRVDRLMWFTLPDQVYNARIWGCLRAANLDKVTDVPRLPHEFQHSLISGSIARMSKFENIQIENAVIWPGIYKMQIDAIKTYNRRWWAQFKETERSNGYLL